MQKSVWYSTAPAYNPAGQRNNVHFYSNDSETFTWDQTTGHMNSWDSTVGTQQQMGTLSSVTIVTSS